ncbi:MAG: radical SAM protein [Actinobacteria bacterium]|nr:radical SAM protein [Actinomycetota bacterium]
MKLFPSRYNYQCKINSRYSILNNFLTGALDIIENNIAEKLLGNDFNPEEKNSDPLSSLIERGYLYENPAAEKSLFNELFENFKIKLKDRPIKFVFCPSYICNLKCSYCFEKGLSKKREKFMTPELLKTGFNTIKEFPKKYGKKISSVELFGGEPLLKRTKDMVFEILDFSSKEGIKVSIITNGVMVKEFIEILNDFKNTIEMLQVTLDGPEFIHDARRKFYSGKGSFKNISEGISLLLKNGINANVRVNIDMENIDFLPDLYSLIEEMKWLESPHFKIQPSKVTDHSTTEYKYPVVRDHILMEKLIEIYNDHPQIEDVFKLYMFKPVRHILDIVNGAENVSPRYYNCESNLIELYMLCPDGYIYTCPESIGIENTAIGKYFPQLELFGKRTKMWTERNILVMQKCRECRFAPICGGGCPYASMLIYRDNLQPVCEDFQPVLDTFIRHRGEKILQKFSL